MMQVNGEAQNLTPRHPLNPVSDSHEKWQMQIRELSVSPTLMELQSWNFTAICSYRQVLKGVKIFPLRGVQGGRRAP